MTRRALLQQALAVPFAASVDARSTAAPGLQILSEPNCLSQESAAGFGSLFASRPAHETRNIIVLCGIRRPGALHLRERALGGAWIVWESSPVSTTEDAFGIRLHKAIVPSSDQLYVRYRWPHTALLRSFSAVIPVSCPAREVIAHYGAVPIAMKRRVGRGGIVFLGSMLGPNLHAQEPQALQLVTAISSSITSACTSTTTSTNT